ncbi:MAG: hypothetical protein IPG23_13685 [Burkholderiales bacterium]|nr:hypothetical protein [Burkholderiales bacterium]
MALQTPGAMAQLETYSNADVNGWRTSSLSPQDDYRLARFVVIPVTQQH